MNRIAGVAILMGSLSLLGGACFKAVEINTNVAGNSNTIELNTNALVNTNSNSNTNGGTNTNISTIDTSDWLTYTNEEYGFSFRYPDDWGSVEENENFDETGGLALLFSNRGNATGQFLITPNVIIKNVESLTTDDSDGGTSINYAEIDFSKSEEELATTAISSEVISVTAKELFISGKEALQLDIVKNGLTGKDIPVTFFIVPAFLNVNQVFQITINGQMTDEFTEFVTSIQFN